MRLLIVSTEFPPYPGGIGTHAYQIAMNLKQMGWEIAVVTQQDYAGEKEINDFNAKQPFSIKSLRPVRPAAAEAMYRWKLASGFSKSWKPDLLVATGKRAVWLSAGLAWRQRLSWVAVGHGTEFGSSVPWERKLTRWAFQRADGIICVSRFTWSRMLLANIQPKSGKVIPNGADDSGFTVLPQEEVRQFRASLGLNGGPLLLTVGNVTDRKGQDIVIRSLPSILKKEPNTHYLIVGKPTKKNEFTELATKLGVAGHVHFQGRADADSLLRYFNSCDIFVMTSRYTADGDFEGYGIAVLEAALCGKPSVVSANSGLIEAISDGETGLSVPENDPISTAEAILSLLSNSEHRIKMGNLARKRTLEERTWKHRAAEYDSFLRGLLYRPDALRVSNAITDVKGS